MITFNHCNIVRIFVHVYITCCIKCRVQSEISGIFVLVGVIVSIALPFAGGLGIAFVCVRITRCMCHILHLLTDTTLSSHPTSLKNRTIRIPILTRKKQSDNRQTQ